MGCRSSGKSPPCSRTRRSHRPCPGTRRSLWWQERGGVHGAAPRRPAHAPLHGQHLLVTHHEEAAPATPPLPQPSPRGPCLGLLFQQVPWLRSPQPCLLQLASVPGRATPGQKGPAGRAARALSCGPGRGVGGGMAGACPHPCTSCRRHRSGSRGCTGRRSQEPC